MSITYKNAISASELNAIRKSMGWWQENPEQLASALDGSAFMIAAYENDQAIGFARLIWEGGGGATIPGIQIMPAYQKMGIEEELINRVLDFLRPKLKPGFGIQVDIRAFGYQESLYEGLGFQISTKERRGVPMHICLVNQIELTEQMFK